MSDTLDLSSVVQPMLGVAGTVITGLLAIYIPKALDALQRRTGIALTDQQRAQVLGAVQTAKGIIETQLDQGILTHAHIDIANDQVRAEAQAAIAAVPNAAAALNMTVDSVSRMIVGAVDTAAHGQPMPPAGTAIVHLTADDIARMIIEKAGLAHAPV